MSDIEYKQKFDNQQQIIMIVRRVQLTIGCLVLGFIIFSIIKRRLHLYNTTKLFMFCCICYLIGMFVVLLYFEGMSEGKKFVYTGLEFQKNEQYILKLLNQIKQNKLLCFACGLEAFLNLWLYDLGYFFGMLISYNVFCVIHGNHRHFIKRIFKDTKVIIFLAFIFLVYLLPFIFMFITTYDTQSFWYSYGPMGIKYDVPIGEETRSAQLLLFQGFQYNSTSALSRIVLIVNLYICPLLILTIHVKILIQNRKSFNELVDEAYLNSKQRFLIYSGRLGIILFVFQSLHFIKLVISFIPSLGFYFNFIINCIFDIYPLVLLSFYIRFTREKMSYQQAETIITSEQ